MKAHVRVDSVENPIHAILASPANLADARSLPRRPHGKETQIEPNSPYRGWMDVIRAVAPRTRDSADRRCYRCGSRINKQIIRAKRKKWRVRATV
jgi:hypothetical protein